MFYRRLKEGLMFFIYANPGSKALNSLPPVCISELAGDSCDALFKDLPYEINPSAPNVSWLKINVSEKAVEGKANAMLLKIIQDWTGHKCKLLSGEKSRYKKVLIFE